VKINLKIFKSNQTAYIISMLSSFDLLRLLEQGNEISEIIETQNIINFDKETSKCLLIQI
jgi:hypothetical protein